MKLKDKLMKKLGGREPTAEELAEARAKRKAKKAGTTAQKEQPELSRSKKRERTASPVRKPADTKKKGKADLKAWRQANGVSAEPDEEAFAPATTWAEAKRWLNDSLVAHCQQKLWAKPTLIQAQCWPIIAAGRDLVAIAETGSGKTLAFALPSLSRIEDKRKKLTMLVLAPTRELAQQSYEVINEFSQVVGSSAAVAFGGVAKAQQAAAIKRCGTLVATPGRLVDLVGSQPNLLSDCEMVALDEADRMLDMGFINAVRTILASLPTQRQTVMCSATWPPTVRQLASEFLRADKVKVATIQERDEPIANARVVQTVIVVDERRRDSKLLETLGHFFREHDLHSSKTIVFGLYKKECARLAQFLDRNQWSCVAIHGDMSQAARNHSFERFRRGDAPILVATDVAARGLDIPNVEFVVNYSFPLTIEDYVHRIGRTGRAGKAGTAITFFHGNNHEKSLAGALQNVLREAGSHIPDELSAYGCTVKKKQHYLYGDFGPKEGLTDKKPTKIVFS